MQVGSIFEFANKNAIFGVVKPDSFLWAPILLFFAITGFPSAGTVSFLHSCTLLINLDLHASTYADASDGLALQHSCS